MEYPGNAELVGLYQRLCTVLGAVESLVAANEREWEVLLRTLGEEVRHLEEEIGKPEQQATRECLADAVALLRTVVFEENGGPPPFPTGNHLRERRELIGKTLSSLRSATHALVAEWLQGIPPYILPRLHAHIGKRPVECAVLGYDIVAGSQLPTPTGQAFPPGWSSIAGCMAFIAFHLNGYLVGHDDDKCLLAFTGPLAVDRAFRCGIEFLHQLGSLALESGDFAKVTEARVRIALHFGTLEEGRGVLAGEGRTRTKRLLNSADYWFPNSLIVTEQARTRLTDEKARKLLVEVRSPLERREQPEKDECDPLRVPHQIWVTPTVGWSLPLAGCYVDDTAGPFPARMTNRFYAAPGTNCTLTMPATRRVVRARILDFGLSGFSVDVDEAVAGRFAIGQRLRASLAQSQVEAWVVGQSWGPRKQSRRLHLAVEPYPTSGLAMAELLTTLFWHDRRQRKQLVGHVAQSVIKGLCSLEVRGESIQDLSLGTDGLWRLRRSAVELLLRLPPGVSADGVFHGSQLSEKEVAQIDTRAVQASAQAIRSLHKTLGVDTVSVNLSRALVRSVARAKKAIRSLCDISTTDVIIELPEGLTDEDIKKHVRAIVGAMPDVRFAIDDELCDEGTKTESLLEILGKERVAWRKVAWDKVARALQGEEPERTLLLRRLRRHDEHYVLEGIGNGPAVGLLAVLLGEAERKSVLVQGRWRDDCLECSSAFSAKEAPTIVNEKTAESAGRGAKRSVPGRGQKKGGKKSTTRVGVVK